MIQTSILPYSQRNSYSMHETLDFIIYCVRRECLADVIDRPILGFGELDGGDIGFTIYVFCLN